MVNLLPAPARRTLRTTYYLRLATVVFFIAALAVLSSAALLVPSYLLAQADRAEAERYLTALGAALSGGENGGDARTLAETAERVSLLSTYPRRSEVATVLSALTAAVPAGIALSQIAITPSDSGALPVSVTGTATTRSALLAFVSTLRASAAFSGVSVPLSQLAGETHIAFTLSFSSVSRP